MTSRFLPLTAVLLALSCASDDGGKKKDNGDPTDDTAGPTSEPTFAGTNGFQLTGQEGSLLALNTAPSVQADGSYSISAMFADDLQGVITPNWCTDGRPCITAFPGAGAQTTYQTGTWEPESSVYNWVGNDMFVGSAKLPFVNDFQRGLAYYTVQLPTNPDGSTASILLGGEWGDHETDDFLVPSAIEITSPDPTVPVGLLGVIPLRWTPVFEGKLYVRFEGDGVNRIFQLENTGEYDLDTAQLGAFDPANVQMFFGLWVERSIEVNGNTLKAFGVWEQPYQGTECTAYPNGVFVGGAGAPVGPDMNPAWVTMGFDGVIDNGLFFDYYNDTNGDNVPEVFTSAVFFDFYEADPLIPGQVGSHLCQVVYDASNSQSTNHISQSGVIYDGFDVQLASGESDCASLDINIWNSVDVRDVLESNQYNWGFGVGEVMDTLPNLQAKYAPDWAIWEPLISGGYVSFDGVFAYEWDEVHVFPMSDCATVEPSKTETDAPLSGPVFTANYNAIPLFAFPFTP